MIPCLNIAQVRVVDFPDPHYLNPAMGESQESYQSCLAGLGHPDYPQFARFQLSFRTKQSLQTSIILN